MGETQKSRLLRECGMIYRSQQSPFISLFENCILDWKDELVDARGEEVLRIQGAIARTRDVINEIKRTGKELKDRDKDGAYAGN